MRLWKSVLNNSFRFSFLASISEEENCEPFMDGTLDVILEMHDGMGNAISSSDEFFVTISDSSEQLATYPIFYDGANGYNKLHLDSIAGVEQIVVLSNGKDAQEVNNDRYFITYYVDGEEMQEDHAHMRYTHDISHHDVRISIQMIGAGTLELFKIKRNAFDEVIPYDAGDVFTIHVEKPGFYQCIELNEGNAFTYVLEDLDCGVYEVREEPLIGYETFYRMNHGEESDCNMVEVASGVQSVAQVINRELPHNILTIEKFIRSRDGDLRKPVTGMFRFRLIANGFDEVYDLCESNQFALDIEDLPPALYTISEENCSDDCFETTYIVNGHHESFIAQIEVHECDNHNVMIINTRVANNECDDGSGIRICKLMRGDDGCLYKPDACDSFRVMLRGCGSNDIFNLNASNNWCVDIDVTCNGYYEVCELDNQNYETDYIVNNDCPASSACFYVDGSCKNYVQVINEDRNKGKLTVYKWIKNECGDLCRPSDDMSFCVNLKSYFCQETFILDKSNNWCRTFENLREGSYEIKEQWMEGFETSYVVNGCKMNKKARIIVENGCMNDVKIINEVIVERTGDLTICKMLRTMHGEFVKPCGNARYEVRIEGNDDNRTCVLDEHNSWCITLSDLLPQTYCIKETTLCDHVSYIVNGQEMAFASVEIACHDQEVVVVNEEEQQGELSINVWLRNCDQDLVKPECEETFQILVEGRSGSYETTLCEANNWCVTFEDLPQGKYRIYQKDDYGYQVSFQIHGVEKHYAKIGLYEEDVQVNIINSTRDCQGEVLIYKRIKENGSYYEPNCDDSFTIRVSGRRYDECFTLDEYSGFCMKLDDLEAGWYTIREMNDCPISILVNGVQTVDGRFCLGREQVEIIVVNEAQQCRVLDICKYVRDENGKLCRPLENECFEILIEGKRYREYFTLDVQNNWSLRLDHLKEGVYTIVERDCGYDVSFIINDIPCENGEFRIDNENVHITMINEVSVNPCVSICKWIKDECGEFFKPHRDEVFEVMIEGEGYKQRFDLCRENDWMITVDDLRCGVYEIKEAYDPNYDAYFQINGEDMFHGKFIVDEHDVDIKVINQDACFGEAEVVAYVCENGEMVKPARRDTFSFTIRDGEKEDCYTLNRKNNWCINIDDLKSGDYTICAPKEGYKVSYEINDCIESCGEFHVECDSICIRLIFEKECAYGSVKLCKRLDHGDGELEMPDRRKSYKFRLCSSMMEEKIVLNSKNDFTWCEDELPCGSYELFEENGGEVSYLMNGEECMDGKFNLNEKGIEIVAINHIPCSSSFLSISCVVKECCGDVEMPAHRDRFKVMVEGVGFQKQFILSSKNNWTIDLAGLKAARYQIIQEENEDFECVMYRIDGGNEKDHANIYLDGDDHHVEIINMMKCESGSIEINKYFYDESSGCLNRPYDHEEFEVKISGRNYEKIVCLDEYNNWSECVDMLKDGIYKIEELNEEHEVSYIVNGEEECAYANIKVEGNHHDVKVINHSGYNAYGSITLSKMILRNGMLQKPMSGSFILSLKSPNMNKKITLNEDNDYMCVVRDLEAGVYQINEKASDCEVSYIVDGGREENEACVEVCGDAHEVQVINHMGPSNKGAISICKYVRGSDGILRKPSGNQQFEAMIRGEGSTYPVYLNANNNWSEVVENISDGKYRVEEIGDYDVSYIVNGHGESERAIVDVCGNMNMVQIINEQRPVCTGSLQLQKFVRYSDGTLHNPSDDALYSVHISKPGFNQCITLDRSNNWRYTLNDLCSGSYVVSEIGGSNVTYIINGGVEVDQAVVRVNENNNTVQIINSQEQPMAGSIEVCKWIRIRDNEFEKPTGMMRYRVRVSSPGYNKVIILDQDNDWCMKLENLNPASYVVQELDTSNVTYIVNGGSEVNLAVVRVNNNVNDVVVINNQEVPSGGSIQLCKWIRVRDNEFEKPSGTMNYRVRVSAPGFNQIVTLDRSNDWCSSLYGLNVGNYSIQELDHEDITYIINGGSEVDLANVQVNDNENDVVIINNPEVPTQGTLQICKWIRIRDNDFEKPSGTMSFQVRVSAPRFNNVYVLDQSNDWCTTITGLNVGNYSVVEMNGTDVTYIVNGGSEVDLAIVHVDNDENDVTIINNSQAPTGGSLQMCKWIRIRDNEFEKPSGTMSFNVRVSAFGYNQIIKLDKDNDWCFTLNNLDKKTYSVVELGSNDVTYIVNGGSEVNNANVVVNDDANEVQIFNNMVTPVGGSIQICKFLRDMDGEIVRPSGSMAYSVRVSAAGFNMTQTLDQSNDWCVSLNNLSAGNYVIDEVDNGNVVTYRINGGSEVNLGVVKVDGNANEVEMINQSEVMSTALMLRKFIKDSDGSYVSPQPGETFEVSIMSNNFYQIYTLEEGNNFRLLIEDLDNGVYQIQEQNNRDYSVSYRVNGKIQDTGEIVLNNGIGSVDILNDPSTGRSSIEIVKFIEDENGNLTKPLAGQIFMITLSGMGMKEKFELNQENNWYIYIPNLTQGSYEVVEQTQGYQVKYHVNGVASNNGKLVLLPGASDLVEIVNTDEIPNLGMLSFEVMVRNLAGELVRPSALESFKVRLSGPGFANMYTMDQFNYFMESINDLSYGEYTLVQEPSAGYRVSYQVNGEKESDYATLKVNSATPNKIVIINTILNPTPYIQAKNDSSIKIVLN